MTNEQIAEELTLKDVIVKLKSWTNTLVNNWKFIVTVSIIGISIGVIYSYYQKPKYTAELTFALEEKSAGGGALGVYAGLASQFGIDVGSGGGGAFSGDNIIELLKSRLLLQKTLLTSVNINNNSMLLIDRYIYTQGYREKWADKPSLVNLSFDEKQEGNFTLVQDSILAVIVKQIKLNQLQIQKIDKKLNIVNVKLVSTDELFAKYFIEELVRNVSNFYVESKTKKSRSNVELLQKRTDSVKQALDREMFGAAMSQDQNSNVIRAQARVTGVRKQMNIQMLSTMYAELVKNLEFSKLALMREEPYIQIIDTPILPLSKEKFGLIKSGIVFGLLFGFLSVLYIIIQNFIQSLK